jgi:uncharacterized protein
MATVIFKPIEACNSNCIYCNAIRRKPLAPAPMPLETLELFFRRINEYLLEQDREQMQILWHGGEPLLLGPDYFRRAIEFQNRHCPATRGRIQHTLQSNLTLLSKDFVGPLKELGIRNVGTSYEPIANLRGGPGLDSAAYNRKFMEALRLLEEEGFSWSIVYVVTKLSLAQPMKIFHFFSNLSPKGALMFNPVLLYGKRGEELKITPKEYADFLGAIFPYWWRHRNPSFLVEPFHSLTQNLLEGSRPLICRDSGRCATSHICLLADGSLSQCGRSADGKLLDYGTIFEKSFSQVLADPQRDLQMRRNAVLQETECKGCRLWDICHGGCPVDAYLIHGSFLHKSQWCLGENAFIEKYFEPTVRAASVPTREPARRSVASHLPKEGEEADFSAGPVWISLIGGLGDMLMILGVLKQVHDRDPSRRFHLVARMKCRPFFEGHPAIAAIGHPPPGARFISTDYWNHPSFRRPGMRAYQVLARIFGLPTPAEERLYLPWECPDQPLLMKRIPWKERNVLLCPGSDSPRKRMSTEKWESLAGLLKKDGLGVVQAGRATERYVRGTYSLLGLTSVREMVGLLRRFDVIVTADNFAMHAAHVWKRPAVVLWGPTDRRVYGYPEQAHLQARRPCEHAQGCIGPACSADYRADCPKGRERCMDSFDIAAVHRAVGELLARPAAASAAPLKI